MSRLLGGPRNPLAPLGPEGSLGRLATLGPPGFLGTTNGSLEARAEHRAPLAGVGGNRPRSLRACSCACTCVKWSAAFLIRGVAAWST